jgi:hypothetical protein
MRRVLALALALAILGVAVPGAWAQPAAPTPQVTITGFIDTVTSWSKNLQDNRFDRTGDTEWYARNRGRFDIIGQLGTAKAVFGFEIDSVWGTTAIGGQDNNLTAAGVGAQRSGATSAFDINTDTQGSIETKWLYTEFQVPMMPFPTIIRVGAQPFATQYKLAAYANGDFAGVNVDMNFTPNVKAHFTYAQVEENLTGSRRALGFGRGDDWAVIASVEVTPIKGLDIRPLYSFFQAYGSTSGSSRNAVGGVTFNRSSVGPGPVNGLGLVENRHTIGVDARWRWGAFSLDPTFFYQFGNRDTDSSTGPAINSNTSSNSISAFFFDVIGGWRLGPLLLEARGVYTTGNKASDNLSNDDVNYYQPLDTDTSYWAAGWGEILSLGIDYFNGAVRGLGSGIGFDRYGRAQFAVRAIYSVTPAFDVRAVVSPAWTAKSVDTNALATFGFGSTSANLQGGDGSGDSSYLGTEVNAGLTWRFAPGLTFDLVGAVLFAGGALDAPDSAGGAVRDAKNVYTIASRIRYSF